MSDDHLPKPHAARGDVLNAVRFLPEPENFFVGLQDETVPVPQNVLMFRQSDLTKSLLVDASHHRYVLIINLAASAVVLLDGLPYPLMPGQALLLFPFQSHRYLPPEQERSLTWLFITFELAETEALHVLRNDPVSIPDDMWPMVRMLTGAYHRARIEPGTSAEVATLLAYILVRLRRQSNKNVEPKWAPQHALPAHRIVQRAARYIATHLTAPITVEGIAQQQSISAGHLRYCFRNVLDTRVVTYIRQTRVCHACSMLSRTESNISEIADHCGFTSVFAFSRAFKREIGMAPTVYRRHMWEEQNTCPSIDKSN